MGKYEKKKTRNVSGALGKGMLFLVSIAALVVCAWLCKDMVKQLLLYSGNSQPTASVRANVPDLNEKLSDFLEAELEDTRQVLLSADKIIKEPKPVYTLRDEDLVAPEPDQSKFGTTDDPSTLGWLLEEAQELLEGQTTYFSTDTKLFAGSEVMYYLDDTILAITWKEVLGYSVYTFSEVKIAHPSQFRRFLAGGEYGSEMQFLTTEMAESVNAVVASSGDFYQFRKHGTSVYMGQVYRVHGERADTCYIDDQGDLHFTYAGELLTQEDAEAYVAEKNIRFSLAFGPVLVDNYERCEPNFYSVGEIDEEYARAALCQMDKLHYLMVTANTQGAYQTVPTIHSFAKWIANTGCKMAYALDGGQTAAIAMNDQLINRVVYGYQRKISDIIYFATAIGGEELKRE